jgi:hypothetical protein
LADDADLALAVFLGRSETLDEDMLIRAKVAIEQDDCAGAIDLHGASGLREFLVVEILAGSFQQ